MTRLLSLFFAALLAVPAAPARAQSDEDELLLELERELSLSDDSHDHSYGEDNRCSSGRTVVRENRRPRHNLTDEDFRSEFNIGAEGTPNIQGAAGTPNIQGARGTPLPPGAGTIKRRR